MHLLFPAQVLFPLGPAHFRKQSSAWMSRVLKELGLQRSLKSCWVLLRLSLATLALVVSRLPAYKRGPWDPGEQDSVSWNKGQL